MIEENTKKPEKKKTKITCVALKRLNCAGVMVSKGDSFNCTEKEYETFKNLKAV